MSSPGAAPNALAAYSPSTASAASPEQHARTQLPRALHLTARPSHDAHTLSGASTPPRTAVVLAAAPSAAPSTAAVDEDSHSELQGAAKRTVDLSRSLQASIAQGRRLPTAEEQTRLFRQLQLLQRTVGLPETAAALPTQSAAFGAAVHGSVGKTAADAAKLRRALLLQSRRGSDASAAEPMQAPQLEAPLRGGGSSGPTVGGSCAEDGGTYRSAGAHSTAANTPSDGGTPPGGPRTPPSSALKLRSLAIADGAGETPEGARRHTGGGGGATAPPTPGSASVVEGGVLGAAGDSASARHQSSTVATTVVLGGAGSLPMSPADTASVASSRFTSVSQGSVLSKAARRRQRRKKLQAALSSETEGSGASSPALATPPEPVSGGGASTRPSSPALRAAEAAAAGGGGAGAHGVPPSMRGSLELSLPAPGAAAELSYDRLGQLDREALLTSARLLLAERCAWGAMHEVTEHAARIVRGSVVSATAVLAATFASSGAGTHGECSATGAAAKGPAVPGEDLDQLRLSLDAGGMGVTRAVAAQVLALRAAVAAAVDGAADAGTAAAALCGDLSAETHDLKSRIAALEGELASATQASQALRVQLEGAAADTQGVAAEVAALQAEVAAAQEDARHWQREADMTQSRVDMLSTQLTKVTTRLNAAQGGGVAR